MSHIPKHIHVPELFNLPLVIPLPSEEDDEAEETLIHGCPSWTNDRLPMFGPLSIEHQEQFLEEQKVLFKERFNSDWPSLESLDLFQDQYILGRGSFTKTVVVKRTDNTKKVYAMKIVQKHVPEVKFYDEKIMHLRRILQGMDFPFCLSLQFLYEDEIHFYFILPFCHGGELFYHLQKNIKFEENVSKFYAAQVVLGLEYMHNCNIIYRNIRPENLLLDHYGYLKIKSFELAKVVMERTYTLCGAAEFIAPEMIKGKGYGKSVDWWALGVLVYEMNKGHPPFISLYSDPMSTYNKILAMKYKMPQDFSDDLKHLVDNLLQTDLSRRLGNLKGGPADIKNHHWFTGIDWLQLLNRKMEPPLLPDISVRNISYPSLITSDTYCDMKEFDEDFDDFTEGFSTLSLK